MFIKKSLLSPFTRGDERRVRREKKNYKIEKNGTKIKRKN